MTELGPEEAIRLARTTTGLPPSVAGRAWRVRRLDVGGGDYWLVELGRPERAVGVAAIAARGGEVLAWAELPGGAAHLGLGAGEAARLAGAAGNVEPVLVWAPGAASRSLLYPLWMVSGPAGTRYVDQQGRVHETTRSNRPGGARSRRPRAG
jgi:hypothetical protein